MVRERTGEQLDAWLSEVEASHLEAFDSFVTGVQQDKDAVFAGLTLPWSNGPLEGNVNRLKLIKRSMYGRANFDLLTVRVLHTRKKSQNTKKKGRAKMSRTVQKNANSQHTTFPISEVDTSLKKWGKHEYARREGKNRKKATKREPMREPLPSDSETHLTGESKGIPSESQNLLYVLRLAASDRRWCLKGIHDHTGGPARSTSVSSISDHAPPAG